MGFTTGDITAPCLTTSQRIHLQRQRTDLNILSWTLLIVRIAPKRIHNPATRESPDRPGPSTYTFSQPLPSLEEEREIPIRIPATHHGQTNERVSPALEIRTLKFTPEKWVYSHGSDKKGQALLGAAVVHIPTRTPIYIYAAGSEEARIIMRAELVDIHTALTQFPDHP